VGAPGKGRGSSTAAAETTEVIEDGGGSLRILAPTPAARPDSVRRFRNVVKSVDPLPSRASPGWLAGPGDIVHLFTVAALRTPGTAPAGDGPSGPTPSGNPAATSPVLPIPRRTPGGEPGRRPIGRVAVAAPLRSGERRPASRAWATIDRGPTACSELIRSAIDRKSRTIVLSPPPSPRPAGGHPVNPFSARGARGNPDWRPISPKRLSRLTQRG
jgi:hypothetical protein